MLYIWSILWYKPDKILKKLFSASLKGVENEAFPVKNLAFKIFIFILIRYLFQIFKQSCSVSFLLMSGLCVFNGAQ